jgi:Cys-rich repeat protein/predicted outer membrane repeat protein
MVNPDRLDVVARALAAGSRRTFLGVLAALPAAGGLVGSLLPQEAEAKERRRRRKQRHKRHKRRKNRGSHKHTRRPCKAEPVTQTCAGKCGSVTNNCKKAVDCGSCTCDPPCDVCYICQDQGPNAPGTCVLDPTQEGLSCGTDGSVCQPDVGCNCIPRTKCPADKTCGAYPDGCRSFLNCGFCSHPTPVCVDNVCVQCTSSDHCASGEMCLAGRCEPCDVSCAAGTCANANLQAVIAAAGAGATIYICPGRYTGTMTLSSDVTLIGAGDGEDETTDTILDAQRLGTVIQIPNGPTVGLQRLHITGGLSTDVDLGAGIDHLGTLLTMTDCTVSNNLTATDQDALNSRGAIVNSGVSELVMTRCTVRNNSTTNSGTDNASSIGGGIFNNNALTLTDCVIRNNTAESRGGGIYSNAGTVTLTGCQITENTLTDPTGAMGGGISVNGGSVTLTDSFVWENTMPDCAGNVIGTGCGMEPSA